MIKQYSLILNNSLSELKTLKSFINQIGLNHNIPKSIISHIQLSLEELIVNVISYSYDDNTNHRIELKAQFNSKSLTFQIINGGKPFNPLTFKPQSPGTNIRKQHTGGLGILLAKNFMDDISYSYKSGLNNLIIIKNLSNA